MPLDPAVYQNSLPQMPLGPLTGFLSGMNQDLANQATQRNFENDDLQKILTKLKIQEDQGTLQSKIDKANYEGAKAQTDQSLLPEYAQTQSAKYSAEQSTAGAQKATADVQQKLAAAPLYVQMAEEAKTLWGGQAQPLNPDYQKWAAKWKKDLGQYADGMPNIPSDGDLQNLIGNKGPQAQQFLNAVSARAQASINTIPFQQKMTGINAEIQGRHTDVAATNESREAAARIAANASMAGHQITADASVQRTQLQLQASKNIEQSLIGSLQMLKARGGVQPQDVPLLRQQAELMVNARPDIQLARTIAATSVNAAEQQAAINQQVQQEALNYLRRDPTFREAEQAAGGAAGGGMGGVPPSNAPQSFTKTPDTPRTLTLSKTQGLPQDLKPGDIVNGHKYLGGPTTNPKSWEQ
jgi:hypothetical protein